MTVVATTILERASRGPRASRRASELPQERDHRWPVVSLLGSRERHRSRRIDDEIAAQLERVPTKAQEPLAAKDEPDVASPQPGIEPQAGHARAGHAPGRIRPPLGVDEHGERDVELSKEAGPNTLGLVVDDKHNRGTDGCDLVPPAEHLHEVHTTDQSACVTQEDEQHRTTAKILEVDNGAVEGREDERRRSAPHTTRSDVSAHQA